MHSSRNCNLSIHLREEAGRGKGEAGLQGQAGGGAEQGEGDQEHGQPGQHQAGGRQLPVSQVTRHQLDTSSLHREQLLSSKDNRMGH